jgi:hypothetical protein
MIRHRTARHLPGWLALVLAPIALPAAFLAGLFTKPRQHSAEAVTAYLSDVVAGKAGAWDWDEFIRVPFANESLEDIRLEAELISLPADDEGRARLEGLLMRARRLTDVAA